MSATWNAKEITIDDGAVYLSEEATDGSRYLRLVEGHHTCEVRLEPAAIALLIEALQESGR